VQLGDEAQERGGSSGRAGDGTGCDDDAGDRPAQEAGSLWAGTPAASGRTEAGGAGAAGSGPGQAPGQGSLWAGTRSGSAAPGDGRDDAAGAAAGGLFAGTPAGSAPGAAKEPQRDAPASEGGLAAACERGHLLDFIRDGASMLVRSAVLQARAPWLLLCGPVVPVCMSATDSVQGVTVRASLS